MEIGHSSATLPLSDSDAVPRFFPGREREYQLSAGCLAAGLRFDLSCKCVDTLVSSRREITHGIYFFGLCKSLIFVKGLLSFFLYAFFFFAVF